MIGKKNGRRGPPRDGATLLVHSRHPVHGLRGRERVSTTGQHARSPKISRNENASLNLKSQPDLNNIIPHQPGKPMGDERDYATTRSDPPRRLRMENNRNIAGDESGSAGANVSLSFAVGWSVLYRQRSVLTIDDRVCASWVWSRVPRG